MEYRVAVALTVCDGLTPTAGAVVSYMRRARAAVAAAVRTTEEKAALETRVQRVIFEKHMELLRSFYPEDESTRYDAISGKPIDKVKRDQLFGPWEAQTDLAKDVYLQLARAAIAEVEKST